MGVCFCDEGCRAFGDCCDDIDTTCPGKLETVAIVRKRVLKCNEYKCVRNFGGHTH